jgi:Protein of unknown function (DUF1501)
LAAPLAEIRNDHDPYAFSMWFSGPERGRVLAATDEFGLRPVENPLVATRRLDHLKLTHFYQIRDMRLTDVHG